MTKPPPQPYHPHTQSDITDDLLGGQMPPLVKAQQVQQIHYHYHAGTTTNIHDSQVNTGTMNGNMASNQGQPQPPPFGAPPISSSAPDGYQNQLQPYRPPTVFRDSLDVETWFFGMDDKDPLAFDLRLHFLVMAVFAGNSLRFIEAVKKMLDQSLRPKVAQAVQKNRQRKEHRPVQPQTPPPPVFQRNLSEIILRTSTRVDTREMGQRQGMTQVCEFVDAQYQIHALNFLSTSPDLQVFRDEFRGWLEGICKADDKALEKANASLLTMTRIQAAIGLGEFAKNDYQHYYRTLIMPYAMGFIGAANPFSNALVLGWMLYQLATDKRYTDIVFDMVKGWASIDGYKHLKAPARDSAELMYQLSQVSLVYTATFIVTPLSFLNMSRTLNIIGDLILQNDLPYQSILLYAAIQPVYRLADNATYLLEMFAEWQRRPSESKVNVKRADWGIRFFLVLIGGDIDLKSPGGGPENPQSSNHQDNYNNHDNSQNANPNPLGQIQSTLGSADPSESANKVASRTIWDVILRGKQHGMNHPEGSLEILVKCTLIHPEARIVDQMTHILTQWIILGDQRPELGNYIYYVLREIKRYKYGYRVIMRLCESRTFTNSHMARHLLHAQ